MTVMKICNKERGGYNLVIGNRYWLTALGNRHWLTK